MRLKWAFLLKSLVMIVICLCFQRSNNLNLELWRDKKVGIKPTNKNELRAEGLSELVFLGHFYQLWSKKGYLVSLYIL